MKSHKLKKTLLILLLLIIIALISMNLNKIYALFGNEEKLSNNALKEDLGVPIESDTVIKEKLTEKITYIGTLYPIETVEINAKIPGQITEITVSEGDLVRKGQVLAKLDSNSISAKLSTTQAKIDTVEFNLEYLRKEEEKYQALVESGGIAQATFDKISHEKEMIEMQLKELYAAKNEIMVNLNDTVLTAPMGGKVRRINNPIGDLAITGKPIVIIDDISQFVVKVNVSESDLNRLRVGTAVSLNISGLGEKILANTTKMMSSIDPKTRIGEVEIGGIKLDKNEQVALGTSVETEFVIDEIAEGYTIPFNAIKQLVDGQVVYKIENDYVKEIAIVTGLRLGNRVQVEGLVEGDKVAIKNIDKLYDHAKVYLFRGDDQ